MRAWPRQKSCRRRLELTRKAMPVSWMILMRRKAIRMTRVMRRRIRNNKISQMRAKAMSQNPMQPVVTLSQVKSHLRLCPSDADENNHLELLISAAVSHASQYLDRPIPWADKDGEPVPVPPDVQAAILLIIGDLYENREGQFVGIAVSENQTVQNLLHFHRIGLGI